MLRTLPPQNAKLISSPWLELGRGASNCVAVRFLLSRPGTTAAASKAAAPVPAGGFKGNFKLAPVLILSPPRTRTPKSDPPWLGAFCQAQSPPWMFSPMRIVLEFPSPALMKSSVIRNLSLT
ncbi:MAG: hypothetical protein CM1200mP2_20290 [Planctomycetaceae bacterium]|nr:MAG: hypothetical protein CM1200mP2_20290 [Planctomycetaceae bacterium]